MYHQLALSPQAHVIPTSSPYSRRHRELYFHGSSCRGLTPRAPCGCGNGFYGYPFPFGCTLRHPSLTSPFESSVVLMPLPRRPCFGINTKVALVMRGEEDFRNDGGEIEWLQALLRILGEAERDAVGVSRSMKINWVVRNDSSPTFISNSHNHNQHPYNHHCHLHYHAHPPPHHHHDDRHHHVHNRHHQHDQHYYVHNHHDHHHHHHHQQQQQQEQHDQQHYVCNRHDHHHHHHYQHNHSHHHHHHLQGDYRCGNGEGSFTQLECQPTPCRLHESSENLNSLNVEKQHDVHANRLSLHELDEKSKSKSTDVNVRKESDVKNKKACCHCDCHRVDVVEEEDDVSHKTRHDTRLSSTTAVASSSGTDKHQEFASSSVTDRRKEVASSSVTDRRQEFSSSSDMRHEVHDLQKRTAVESSSLELHAVKSVKDTHLSDSTSTSTAATLSDWQRRHHSSESDRITSSNNSTMIMDNRQENLHESQKRTAVRSDQRSNIATTDNTDITRQKRVHDVTDITTEQRIHDITEIARLHRMQELHDQTVAVGRHQGSYASQERLNIEDNRHSSSSATTSDYGIQSSSELNQRYSTETNRLASNSSSASTSTSSGEMQDIYTLGYRYATESSLLSSSSASSGNYTTQGMHDTNVAQTNMTSSHFAGTSTSTTYQQHGIHELHKKYAESNASSSYSEATLTDSRREALHKSSAHTNVLANSSGQVTSVTTSTMHRQDDSRKSHESYTAESDRHSSDLSETKLVISSTERLGMEQTSRIDASASESIHNKTTKNTSHGSGRAERIQTAKVNEAIRVSVEEERRQSSSQQSSMDIEHIGQITTTTAGHSSAVNMSHGAQIYDADDDGDDKNFDEHLVVTGERRRLTRIQRIEGSSTDSEMEASFEFSRPTSEYVRPGHDTTASHMTLEGDFRFAISGHDQEDTPRPSLGSFKWPSQGEERPHVSVDSVSESQHRKDSSLHVDLKAELQEQTSISSQVGVTFSGSDLHSHGMLVSTPSQPTLGSSTTISGVYPQDVHSEGSMVSVQSGSLSSNAQLLGRTNVSVSSSQSVTQSSMGRKISEGHQTSTSGSKTFTSVTHGHGPSDEMWHVPDSAFVSPSSAEIPDVSVGSSQQNPNQETSTTTSLEVDSNSTTVVVKRSSKTLWGFISNFIKGGWAARSGAHESPPKPAGGASSTESETWFSGNEREEEEILRTDKRAKAPHGVKGPEAEVVIDSGSPQAGEITSSVNIQTGEITSTVNVQGTSTSTALSVSVPASPHKRGRTHRKSPGHSSQGLGTVAIPTTSGLPTASVGGVPIPPGLSMPSVGGIPISPGFSTPSVGSIPLPPGLSTPLVGGIPMPPGLSIPSVGNVPLPPGLLTPSVGGIPIPPGLSIPSVGGTLSVGAGANMGTTEGVMAYQGSETQIAPVNVGDIELTMESHEASPSGDMPGDHPLRHGRLTRAKQVPKERFEAWEDAYKLEAEQKKMDEVFMREALVEARKAADLWEVPVGAVLVQDGKILARGHNLVEELRDPTAHAEMNCIREASSLLKTWRLAGTTLYITLEPCPMCAGAILQARVDVLVWGAPNKLLGADGSWVRLFPSSDEGESSGLDLQNMNVGPVHPFHPNMKIRRNVLGDECADMMQQFFHLRRKKTKRPESPSTSLTTNPTKFFSKMHQFLSMVFCF